MNPVQKQGQQVNRPGSEEDDIKKLLSMLGDNEELNKKDWVGKDRYVLLIKLK